MLTGHKGQSTLPTVLVPVKWYLEEAFKIQDFYPLPVCVSGLSTG